MRSNRLYQLMGLARHGVVWRGRQIVLLAPSEQALDDPRICATHVLLVERRLEKLFYANRRLRPSVP
jgi:hypothetical protein